MLKSLVLAAMLTILAPPTIAHNGGAPSMPIPICTVGASDAVLDELVVTIEKPKVKTKVKTKQKKKKVWKAPAKSKPKFTGHSKSVVPDTHKSFVPDRPLGSHDSQTKIVSHVASHLTTGPPCG